MSEKKDYAAELAKLAHEVAQATKDFEAADGVESMARCRASDAKNRLNEAQKNLDLLLAEWKKASIRDSDWWSAQHRGQRVEVSR